MKLGGQRILGRQRQTRRLEGQGFRINEWNLERPIGRKLTRILETNKSRRYERLQGSERNRRNTKTIRGRKQEDKENQ